MADHGPGIGLTGGCQCGAVRYRLIETPRGATLCHCRMCQKASGGPFMAFAGLDRENFIVTHGRLSTFASSEFAERGFCSACGTPLTYRAVKSARISVTLGSLDDPNAVAPDSQLGAESQVQWLPAALSHSNVRVDAWLTRLNIADVGSRQHPDHET